MSASISWSSARTGVRIGFTQIAGLVARRILSFVKEGDRVEAGERIGLIRFGSRVDVYLPAGTGSQVLLGQRTIAGETILGELGVDPQLRRDQPVSRAGASAARHAAPRVRPQCDHRAGACASA